MDARLTSLVLRGVRYRNGERGSGGGRWEINKTVTYLTFSRRQAYTRHFSLLYLRCHPPSSFAISLSPSTLPVAIYPSHFSCFYLSRSDSGAPRMRDLKQLKRSAKHFNLASGAFMPRARARVRIRVRLDIHLSVSSRLSRPILSFRCVFLVLSARCQVADAKSRRRAYYLRSSREWKRRVVWARVASRREAENAQDGPTSIKWGQEKCEEDRKEPRVPRGGGRTVAAVTTEGGDGLTPVCLRGANGVLQLF